MRSDVLPFNAGLSIGLAFHIVEHSALWLLVAFLATLLWAIDRRIQRTRRS